MGDSRISHAVRKTPLAENERFVTAGRKNITSQKAWGTPPHYVKAVKRVLGRIDLDPCSSPSSVVGAATEYVLPEIDGLQASWDFDTIYVNPPYGADKDRGTKIKDWLRKCVSAHQNYGAQIIALIPVAPNTSHWKECIWGQVSAICFLYDTRLKFLSPNVIDKGAPMACAAVYWGDGWKRFSLIFREFGAVVRQTDLAK